MPPPRPWRSGQGHPNQGPLPEAQSHPGAERPRARPWARADSEGHPGAAMQSRPGAQLGRDAGACAASPRGPSGPEVDTAANEWAHAPPPSGRRGAGFLFYPPTGTHAAPCLAAPCLGRHVSSETRPRAGTKPANGDGLLGAPESAAAGGGWPGGDRAPAAATPATRPHGLKGNAAASTEHRQPSTAGRASAHGLQTPDRRPSPAKPRPQLPRGRRASSGRKKTTSASTHAAHLAQATPAARPKRSDSTGHPDRLGAQSPPLPSDGLRSPESSFAPRPFTTHHRLEGAGQVR